MKNRILTLICAIMMLLPWTILPLRTFDWALIMPAAEVIIYCYIALMLFSGIFTIFCYIKAKMQSSLMKICLVVNSLYAAAGTMIFFMCIQKYF